MYIAFHGCDASTSKFIKTKQNILREVFVSFSIQSLLLFTFQMVSSISHSFYRIFYVFPSPAA